MIDVDAIIAEANAPAAATEQKAQATSEEAQAIETPTKQENTESLKEAEDISKKPDSELTPEQLAKREENRQSHLNRKLAKQRLRNENAELKARLAQLEQKAPEPKANTTPKLEDYNTLEEWVLATAEHLAKSKTPPEQQSNPADSHKIQRAQEIDNQKQALIKEVPEYVALVKENNDYLHMMSDAVQDAFYEANNAPLALYALMKEGRLEDLEDLSPRQIAMEIGRAEERGKSYLGSVKKATSAPPPIESLKGTGRASKALDEMSVEELMKHFQQR